jgi:hypothetical protein
MRTTKRVWTFLILIMSLNIQAHDRHSRLKGIDLQTCRLDRKCLRLKTQSAESGELSSIMTFNSFDLRFLEQGRERVHTGEFGYFDAQENKLILTLSSKRELEINLRDLSEKFYD